MSPCATPSRLAKAEKAGKVLVVEMNDVKFVAFRKTDAIGTRDLAGCSVVVIASGYGAILAHIPPRPIPDTSPTDPEAGSQNVRRLMKCVESLYGQLPKNFTNPWTAYACFAIRGEGIALPHQKEIIEDYIIKMGLEPFKTIFYVTARDPENPDQGMLFVDSSEQVG